LLFLPLSQVVVWFGLADSITSLMVTYPTFLVPFCTWLLMGYFRTIPREVEECALVDGATRMQTLWKVVLPMAVPGIICAVLFSFTLCWNEFTYALTFISQSAHKTAVVGVTSDLIRGDIYFWGSLMAGALLASIPIVIIYVLFLDYYVSGLTAGAVKGKRSRRDACPRCPAPDGAPDARGRARLPPARPYRPADRRRTRLPATLGDLDELHQPLAAARRHDHVRRPRQLPAPPDRPAILDRGGGNGGPRGGDDRGQGG